MPHKRKDSPYWWVSYTDSSGQRIRRSSGTSDYKEAKALEGKLKTQTWQEQEWGRQQDIYFEDVLLPYLEYAQRELRSWQELFHQAKKLREHFAGQIMNHLGAKEINAYKLARQNDGVSNATINRELSCLSAAINHCKTEREWELPNPVAGRKLKEPEGRVRWITRAEVESIRRAALKLRHGKILADFISLAVHTGCRMNELLGLEWNRVDWSNQLLILEGEHTKAGKRRSIPLNSSALAALRSRMSDRATYCPATTWVFARHNGARVVCLRAGFTKACNIAGIKNLRIHDLRHTCAAWLVTAGVPLSEVRDLLGHSTIMMTEKYAHLAPARVAQAVQLLDSQDTGKSRFGHAQSQSLKALG